MQICGEGLLGKGVKGSKKLKAGNLGQMGQGADREQDVALSSVPAYLHGSCAIFLPR